MSAVIAASVAAAATVVGLVEQNEARKDQRKANRKAARIEVVQGVRARARALADNRVTQAQVFALAANAGVQGSSGVQGSLGSLATEGAANLNFANTIDQLNAQRLKALGRAENAANIASMSNQVAGIGFDIAGG